MSNLLTDDTVIEVGTWGNIKEQLPVMTWTSEELDEVCKNDLTESDAEIIRQLRKEQAKQGDMAPLNKLQRYCQCWTVKCKFRQENFFMDEFKKILAINKE